MSNILPQSPELNRNAWSSLEHNIRLWAEILGEIHVVTGAFFGHRSRRLGNTVAIPKGFYKVIYSDLVERAIAFYYPNKPLHARELWRDEYVMSIRTLEDQLQEGDGTMYCFFPLIGGSVRRELQDDCDIDYWLALLSKRKKRR
jgi:DNA/RNA endonuclease G (NUC1)